MSSHIECLILSSPIQTWIQHGNADGLSRLPLPESVNKIPTPGETILMLENLQTTPVNIKHVRQWTDRDPVLSKVRRLVQQGWEITDDQQYFKFERRSSVSKISVSSGEVE